MDPSLLKYYNRELQHIREVGGEFAKEFPKIASRLGMEGMECADPYVERLIEGFAFLAARVQLKLDAEFPRFTQHLLEMVYPHYLAPTPSMAVVQLRPDLSEGALSDGFPVPRDSSLRSMLAKGEQTPCEYRTAQDVTLWPLELVEAEYFPTPGEVAAKGIQHQRDVRAGIRLRVKTTTGVPFSELPLDRLPLFLRGGDELPMRLYEQLVGNSVGLAIRSTRREDPWIEILGRSSIQPLGFDDAQCLLPYGPRSFHGYRLLHEYFAFPERYLFVELQGLSKGVRRCEEEVLDLIFLLNRSDNVLDDRIDHNNFVLFCTPAINLFPKRTDRIHLTNRVYEYHVVPDRTRPLDFEVYQVTGLTGFGTSAVDEQDFRPFYATTDISSYERQAAFYTVHRLPRLLSSHARKYGPRSSYVGSEVFVSLVDAHEAPYRSDLRQLALTTLCTNRDLPLQMPVGRGETDFSMQSGAPVESVRCVAGPTKPRPAPMGGATAWRLISHLALNYLTITDTDDKQGAAGLRDLLKLYSDVSEAHVRKQIDGVVSVTSRPVTRRLPSPGPITFGRGIEVTLDLAESAFEGAGVFLLGAVLEQFFARYTSINSFTETVIRTDTRGEVMRWPTRIGRRHTL